jgi:CheY-like chemotaxis protein
VKRENIVKNSEFEDQVSNIIQGSLIDQYGVNGYKSIIQIMVKQSGKAENEIVSNYKLFEKLIKRSFGEFGNSKILEHVKVEIGKIDENNILQNNERITRILIAEDNLHILKLYKEWLEFENNEVVIAENGQKGLEIYQKEHHHHQSENYFDVVILDQKMPKMTGVQTAKEILKINPHQRIIIASAYVEKTLLDSLAYLNKAIEVIEKPFSLESLTSMINQTTVYEKLEVVNTSKDWSHAPEKISGILEIIKN